MENGELGILCHQKHVWWLLPFAIKILLFLFLFIVFALSCKIIQRITNSVLSLILRAKCEKTLLRSKNSTLTSRISRHQKSNLVINVPKMIWMKFKSLKDYRYVNSYLDNHEMRVFSAETGNAAFWVAAWWNYQFQCNRKYVHFISHETLQLSDHFYLQIPIVVSAQ